MTPDQLKKQRHELQLTQADMAKAFGVSRNALINWERGKNRIPRWMDYALSGLQDAINESAFQKRYGAS
jgi:transcriptional regulator with XRE-family HTH domain